MSNKTEFESGSRFKIFITDLVNVSLYACSGPSPSNCTIANSKYKTNEALPLRTDIEFSTTNDVYISLVPLLDAKWTRGSFKYSIEGVKVGSDGESLSAAEWIKNTIEGPNG